MEIYHERIRALATSIPDYKHLCATDKAFGRVYEIARMFYNASSQSRDQLINLACEAVGAYGYLASVAYQLETEASIAEITVKDIKNAERAKLMDSSDMRVTEAKDIANSALKEADIDVEKKKLMARQYKVCAELAEKLVSITQTMVKAYNNEQYLEGRKVQ